MLKLYWAPQTRSFSALWVLEEAGVPYEKELVDIRSGVQDTPAYRRINLMGKVPALRDGDMIVAEQGAVCAWVADRFPEAGLAPSIDDPKRGAYLRWLFFAGNCIEPAYMQKFSGWSTVKSRAGWGNYELVVDVLDDAVKEGPWVLGERFSAADVMIGGGVYFGMAFGVLPERPSFAAYRERCVARPAFQRTLAIEQEAASS
ncbi:MAG: glutathione S-transferase family protein [Bradyrhizobiaceae bacterium]|nr:glutathione S-transferase family protein [Bradyrhizobiaceae bacterium]